MRKALLVFHAPRDNTVGIDNAEKIFKAAKHPKSFISLDEADHLLTRKADAIYVANMLAACAARYVGAAAETPQEAAVTEPGIVTVRGAGTGRPAQEKIGRAAGRERGCQYVETPGVARSLKKK